MNVVNFIQSIYGGGAEKYVADISCYLNEVVNHNLLITKIKEKSYDYCGKITQLKSIKVKLLNFLSYIQQIKKIKKSTHVFISHLWVANIYNCLTKSNTSKTILYIHGKWSITPEKGFIIDKLTESLYNKADAIICVSHAMKQLISSHYNITTKVFVNHIGVNSDAILEKSKQIIPISLPKKYIVYVSGLRPVKNHLKLLDNIGIFLKETEYKLVIVGDGVLKNEILSKIASLKLHDHVILTGNIKNPYPIIKNASYSLLTSASESFSLVCVESIVLGTPILATDCGGPREILAPQLEINKPINYPFFGQGGVLIDKEVKQSIGEIISQLDQNKGQKKQLIKDGIKNAAQFSIEESAKRLVNIINNLN